MRKLLPPIVKSLLSSSRQFHNLQQPKNYDLIVVGGGIVGTASAREILLRHPHLKIAIIEKERKLAYHQSGHNSGVIHAGIYYKPGSLKAKLCVEGMNLAYQYLEEKKIPYKKCGKLIVATSDAEIPRLMDLYKRAQENNVKNIKLLDGIDEIQKIEPYCQGLKALWSPDTGIVDWANVTRHYCMDFKAGGGDVYTNYEAKKFTEGPGGKCAKYPIIIHGAKPLQKLNTKYVLTCAGLQSDLVAEKTGCSPSPRIVPFRGEYLLLAKEVQHMVQGNIYPVPDPNFPFLGVHFTPRVDGSVWLGPNAILAFKREGYKWSDINLLQLADSLRYPGFLRLAANYFRFGIREMYKSIFISAQIKDAQRFIPEITEFDVRRGPAGVRAQALDLQGNLVDDFVFDRGSSQNLVAQRVLHCRNAPSPGATSSLAIAKMVADKIEQEFNLCK